MSVHLHGLSSTTQASSLHGSELMQEVIKYLEEHGLEYKNYGTYSTDSCDYPDYAKKVADELKHNDVDVTVDNRAEKIGYKIREARMDKLPYMLVVGADEEADGTVSVRSRFEGNEGVKPLSDFIDQICKEIRTKEIRVELPEEEKHR